MSITDKFNYLKQAKENLKEVINLVKDEDEDKLTEESTFRSYPQELFNGYLDVLNNGTDTLWSNLEKVSQTGTEAVLENVETAPIKMVLNGNTSQDTTTGKNLLGLTNGTYSHNGITAVVNDGAITITGTATANSFVNIPLIKDIVLSNEQVTASINNATTISDTATEFRVYESGTNYIPVQFTTINRKTTTTKSGTFISAYVRTSSGVSYDNGLVIKPQLEYGSTATSWEKYTGGQPSPSPDYPQQVKVVTGENVVSVSGKNLFDITKAIQGFLSRDTGVFTPSTSSVLCVSEYIKITEGIEYYIQAGNPFYSVFYDENKEYLAPFNSSGNVRGTAPEGAKYIRVVGPRQNNVTMLFEGSTVTSYVPYSKTNYPISLGTLELCKIGNYQDYFHKDSGKWYVHKTIEKVVLDGSESWTNTYGQNLFDLQMFLNNKPFVIGYGLSNYYKYNPVQSRINNNTVNGEFVLQADKYSARYNIFIKNTDYTSTEDFKTWLSTHNTIVYYVLATPTETEITNTTLIEQLEAISKAKSVKDKTYITQTNEEILFIIDATAIKKYEEV